METALTNCVKTSILLKPEISNSSSVLQVAINCKSFRSIKSCKPGWALERKLRKEMNLEEEIVGKWKENCSVCGGLVELMGCLEREAIMGEDEGKEATDYNIRAQIFDTSFRVFKALKESTDDS